MGGVGGSRVVLAWWLRGGVADDSVSFFFLEYFSQ